MRFYACEQCNHKLGVEDDWAWDFKKCPVCGHRSPLEPSRALAGASSASPGQPAQRGDLPEPEPKLPPVLRQLRPRPRREVHPLWWALLGLGGLLLLAAISLGPTLYRKWTEPPYRAAGTPVRQGDAEVTITSVVVGRPAAYTDFGRSKTTIDSDRLLIKVRIRNAGSSGTLHYSGWTPALALGDKESAPQLEDDSGKEIGIYYPPLGAGYDGQVSSQDLAPGQSVEDLLVFEVPPPGAKYLRLRLPGGNAGQAPGQFNFQIPRKMYAR